VKRDGVFAEHVWELRPHGLGTPEPLVVTCDANVWNVDVVAASCVRKDDHTVG
jgi:hypothetical protein